MRELNLIMYTLNNKQVQLSKRRLHGLFRLYLAMPLKLYYSLNPINEFKFTITGVEILPWPKPGNFIVANICFISLKNHGHKKVPWHLVFNFEMS